MNVEQISEKLQKIGKDRFILLFLAGLMLVIIVMPWGENEGKKKQEENVQTKEVAVLPDNSQIKQDDVENYRLNLCRQLEQFLQRMEGVGIAKVYITMHSSSEKIVERNSPYAKRTEEETAQESTRVINETENESEVVLIRQEDGSEAPIIVKEIVPTVRGVVVAAQGADNEMIKKEITALVMALFGIEEHKIRVVKLST
ncbi:MAG: hypothetical protein J6B19_07220 [Lachnospiraceae bacterium]|nr:hypothetical protein [Lachnospiraceae bacterium]